MTEKIQKAIDKIDQEAEKMGSATVRLLCSHIIDHCLVNDSNADKVLAEGKSLKGCWDHITSNARKQAAGNCAAVPDDTVCCPVCGHEVQVKDAGRGRSQLINTAVVAVTQRTRNGGILLSFVRVYEDYTRNYKAAPERGTLLYAAYFNLGQHFVAEQTYGGGLYISVKSKPARQLPCTVEPVKLNHNNWKCTQGEGAKLLGFEEALEKSNLRYLPWEAYHECAQQLYQSTITNYPVNLLGLLYQYSRYPVLTERLIKEGNGDLVAEQVEWDCTTGMDYKQVVPYKAMRLTKQEYRKLKMQDNICCSTLKATKALKKYGCKMTDENVRFFSCFPTQLESAEMLQGV